MIKYEYNVFYCVSFDVNFYFLFKRMVCKCVKNACLIVQLIYPPNNTHIYIYKYRVFI